MKSLNKVVLLNCTLYQVATGSWQDLEQTLFITYIMLKIDLEFLNNGLENVEES